MKTNVHFVYVAGILLSLRNFSDKVVEESKRTYFAQQLFSENLAVYEIMLENRVEPDRKHMTIRHMRFACWIHKATDTLLEYVILAVLSGQHWLREGPSLVRLCAHCLSC